MLKVPANGTQSKKCEKAYSGSGEGGNNGGGKKKKG